jgi:hypothetical protein
MGLFKRAAVRGVAHELIRQGVVAFPSKEAADAAADEVADKMPEQAGPQGPGAGPEVSGPQGHSPEEVAAVAQKLIEIAQALMAQAGAGGPPAAAAAKMGAETLYKSASEVDADTYGEVASKVAVELMEKASAEAKQAGALIEGGDKGNKPAQAAKTHEIAALDEKQRPQGTYQVPTGDSSLKTMQGHIGSLEKHDKQPKESPSGGNSLTEDPGKKASEALYSEVRKIAGALIKGGDKGNTFDQAAKTTEVGALDKKQRPEEYAHVGQGNANFSEPQAARVGLEKKPDVTPSRTVSGSNSVIEASKAASYSAEFLALFNKCAAEVVPQLPTNLSDEQKVAAVRHMMGMDEGERAEYITSVKKASENKQGGDAAEAMAALKGNEETKEPKKEEKGEKKSALLEEINKIATAQK